MGTQTKEAGGYCETEEDPVSEAEKEVLEMREIVRSIGRQTDSSSCSWRPYKEITNNELRPPLSQLPQQSAQNRLDHKDWRVWRPYADNQGGPPAHVDSCQEEDEERQRAATKEQSPIILLDLEADFESINARKSWS